MLIDTHAHLNIRAFKEDADEVIKNTLQAETWLVNVGVEYSTSQRSIAYAEKYPEGVYAAVGIHPTQLKKSKVVYETLEERVEYDAAGEKFDFDKYVDLAEHPKVVAIGEVGLDYHHFEPEDNLEFLKNQQQEVFSQFIDVCNVVQKPIMLHCWDAFPDLLKILKKKEINKKGIIHSFSSNYKTAQELRNMGFILGFNGVVTYTDSYDRVIRETPLEEIVLETDCPYLTPKPLDKTKRNEPLNVRYVAERIAEVKNISIDQVTEITTNNARKLLNI